MGEVWAAWDEKLDREVALKVMRGSMIDNDEFRARFLAEGRRQAKLSHPNIPPIYDYFAEAAGNCLVLQLIDGESLQAKIDAHGSLDIPVAIRIAQDLLSALDYAHQHGIIHRDVKPSNVIVANDGRAYLIDFGVALAVGEARLTKTGAFVGTFEYTSPEQIRTPRSVDHRTDVYSAGCVIYEMLAGRPPFSDTDHTGDFEIQRAHVFEKPKPLRSFRASVPPEVDRVVLWSLEKDLAARLPGCGAFSRLLGEALNQDISSPAIPLPDNAGSVASAPVRKRRVPVFFKVLLILVLIWIVILAIGRLLA